MDTLIMALTVWISGVTGLPPTHDLPRLTFRSPPAIERLYGQQNKLVRVGDAAVAVAFYDPSRREIALPLGWQPDNPFHLSILVHELVHHMQAEAGLRYECSGARERVAYSAQQRWLESQGLDLFDNEVLKIDRMFHLIVTSCQF